MSGPTSYFIKGYFVISKLIERVDPELADVIAKEMEIIENSLPRS